jgi:hypothetical protein
MGLCQSQLAQRPTTRYYDLDEPSQRADTCHGDEKNAVAATPSVGFETVNTFGPFNARYHKFV